MLSSSCSIMSAIWPVIRSCTCGRRATSSTTRASLLRPGHAAVGDVGHVRHAAERQQVVLAHAGEADVADQHDFVVLLGKRDVAGAERDPAAGPRTSPDTSGPRAAACPPNRDGPDPRRPPEESFSPRPSMARKIDIGTFHRVRLQGKTMGTLSNRVNPRRADMAGHSCRVN